VCVVVRICKCVIVAGTLSLSGGCQSVGPIAIDQGRERYNHIIQQTSKEQTFANIIRVKHHEPTTFMDVTEVDASTTVSGSVSGGLTNMGAIPGTRSTTAGTINGTLGNVGGGVTYTEAPLIRYQPLLGQALVGQLATPVSPDALASLYDSNWAVAPLLDLASAYLVPRAGENAAALNAIAYLAHNNRVELVAEKSELTKGNETASGHIRKSNAGNVTLEVTNKAASTATDALVVYLLPPRVRAKPEKQEYIDAAKDDGHIWNLLLRIYAGTQARPAQKTSPMCRAGQCSTVGQSVERARNRIELRTKPVTPDKTATAHLATGAPVLRTYSALGILKNAMEGRYPLVGFVTPACYSAVRSHLWNNSFDDDPALTFFTLLPSEEDSPCGENDQEAQGGNARDKETRHKETPDEAKRNKAIADWLTKYDPDAKTIWKDTPFIYLPNVRPDQYPDQYLDTYITYNNRLTSLRRHMLVIHSDSPPTNAYVAYFDRGEWYYIAGDDQISQKNFQLITLFLTMMAVPGGTQQPLTPAISVGGG
jgi:hypothetical protein